MENHKSNHGYILDHPSIRLANFHMLCMYKIKEAHHLVDLLSYLDSCYDYPYCGFSRFYVLTLKSFNFWSSCCDK